MGLFGSKPPKPKAVFGSGSQKELFGSLFAEGGPIAALLRGGPDPGFEAGVGRGLQGLNQNLAQQGLFGSPLGGRAAMDFAQQSAVGREQNRLGTLLSATRPIGAGGGGGGGGTMSLLGL